MAQIMCQNNIQVYPGHEALKEEVIIGVFASVADATSLYYKDLVSLPGFDALDKPVLTVMGSNGFLSIYGALVHSRMLINGEWFRQLPNGIQFTFKHMGELMGNEAATRMRKFLQSVKNWQLTENEAALLIPYMLTLAFGKENLVI